MGFNKEIKGDDYLNRKYDHYFLFYDNEIYNNPEFNRKIKKFSLKNSGDYLIVDLINLKNLNNYKDKTLVKIPAKSNDSLEYLDSIYIEENKTYDDLLFEFLIFDSIHNWEIYCNIGMEFAIAGCTNDIVNRFIDFLMPYKDFSLKEKLEELNIIFINSENKTPLFDNVPD